jgi:hypothetical protein
VVLGFEFLWAFLDKTFGFGYATPSARAWINGGSPTKGFLSNVAVGPFESTFHAWAGAAWADWLFMVGLLAIGLALVLGIGLRVAAVSGSVMMMLLMWAAEWPLAKFTSAGEPAMSTNPIVDSRRWLGETPRSATPGGTDGQVRDQPAPRTRSGDGVIACPRSPLPPWRWPGWVRSWR